MEMDLEQVRKYIYLCKQANVKPSVILDRLEKQANAATGSLISGLKAFLKDPKVWGSAIVGGGTVGGINYAMTDDGYVAALQNKVKNYEKNLVNLTERDKKQQKDWFARAGIAGAGIGGVAAPLLFKKNPALASAIGVLAGASIGSLGGAAYSELMGDPQ